MRRIRYDSPFLKDLKRFTKKHYSFDRLDKIVMELYESNGVLHGKYRDHALVGDWAGYRELHVEPNILLVYKVTEDEIILARLGTHDDLF